jgi:hypothetical protein
MRRTAAAVALALAAATIGAGGPSAAALDAPDDRVPAAASAAWLVGLLGPDAVLVDPALGVEDVDATLDLLLGLVASGAAGDTRDAVADRLAADAAVHTGATIDATFVSATAKLVLALDAAGRDPRDAAGTDLVAILAGRVGTDGRATDRAALGDLATPASQALAVLALVRSGADAALVLRAADALAVSACADGGVPAEFDAEPCTTGPVATALAAAALAAAADAAGADAALAAARDDALTVLVGLNADGDLGPWAAGLTATALRSVGRDGEADAVAAALAARIDGCDGGATAAVADDADPLRATVGVLLATSGRTLVDLTADVAAATATPLDCSPGGDGPDAVADDEGDAVEAAGADDASSTDDDAGDAGGAPTVLLAAAVLGLAVLAGVPVLRRSRRRDEADRAAARGAARGPERGA